MNPGDLLHRLVSTPSLSGDEGAVADFVGELAESWGFQVHRLGNNRWFRWGSGARRLLLATHLDTVPPCAGWDGDPHQPRWTDGRLSGLGANDAKGCVAAMLTVACLLKDEDLDGTVLFAFTAEEETGGAEGMGRLLPTLGPLDAALVGEPTGLRPCIAQRGMLILTCTARGESGHVAHAELGANAIHKAARDIGRLSAMAFEPHPLLGATRPQVTVIQGGVTANQIPDACSFTVDLRTTPNLDHSGLAERLSRDLESEVAVRSARYLPKATDARSPVALAALAATAAPGFVGSATASDWAFLGDLPAVKIGPGDTHRSHRPNEFLLESELREGIGVYLRTIRNYFALTEEVGHGA